jgi:hypothetical protein
MEGEPPSGGPEAQPVEGEDGKSFRRRALPTIFQGVKGTAALIAAIVTIAAAIGWVVSKYGDWQQDRPGAETDRLEKLKAGVTFTTFKDTLGGQEPEVQRPVGESPDASAYANQGVNRYVFIRDYDFVQAVVDSNNTVIGFSIVARTDKIDPSFEWAGQKITLGKSDIALDAPFESPVGVGGFCGANRFQYFEEHGGSNAVGVKEFSVGVTNLGFGDPGPAICPASRQLYDCGVDNSYVNVVFSPAGVDCFIHSAEGQRIRALPINTYVESAPAVPIFSDMLSPIEEEVRVSQ